MKRAFALFMALIMILSLCACGKKKNTKTEDKTPTEVETKEDVNSTAEDKTENKEEKTPDTPAAPQPKQEHVHSYSDRVVREASCESSGQVDHVCSCGDSYATYTDPLGHNFSGGTCTRCGTKITSLCSVSSINCPDKLTYHFTNQYGIEIKTNPLYNLSVSDVYFEARGDDVVLHLTLTGRVSSNVADGDGFGYVVLGGNGSGKILIPASSDKNYTQYFEFTGITPGSYTISIEDF